MTNTKATNRIFLIDGHAQIFRMYYAFMRRPMINSKGVDTSILFGFTKLILELIAKENPTHIAVAFDPHAKTFRHTAYPQYKANRSAAPELIIQSLEPLIEILKAFNIPVVMIPGFEADDVIGSMATQWQNSNSLIYMVTPDKDYGQLISPYIYQYKPAKGSNEIQLIGEKEICEQYSIPSPKEVVDVLTIIGDASDNVPGIKGIGEVGAKKLMAKYGSLDEIISRVEELPAKQQENIKNSIEQIEMSRFLVTIKCDIQLPITLNEIALSKFNSKYVDELFNKFEFSSLRRMLPETLYTQNELFNGVEQVAVEHTENLVYKRGELNEFIELMVGEESISVVMRENRLVFGVGNKYFVVEQRDLIRVAPILENSNIAKIGVDIKGLYKFLWDNSINIKGVVWDVEIMHYLLNPERSHKLDMLIKSYLTHLAPYKKEESEHVEMTLFSMEQQEQDGLLEEDGYNAVILLQLKDKLKEELQQQGQLNLYLDMEAKLIEVLAAMEYSGVRLDLEFLNNYSLTLIRELELIEAQAKELAEEQDINLSSPKQVANLLYKKLKLGAKVKKSKSGNLSTDEETLTELLHLHPVVGKILEYRGVKKLISTYTNALPLLVNKKSGNVHTTFQQSLTATGRLSSTNPNLQNIPIRTARGREVRRGIISSFPNGVIISADYSQIELRLMAHISGDIHLIDAFNRGMDIHTATAAKIFKVKEEEVTAEQRSKAKTANFGIIYGISAFGLSQRLSMSRADSKQLIEDYYINYPGVKEYIIRSINKAKEEGYVSTIYGRKRFLPDINSRNANVRALNERNAINAPLQGSAADIIKVAMINSFKAIKEQNLKSKMILQVHDELIFDVAADEIDIIKGIVVKEMEGVIKLAIPLIAQCGVGKNWLEAH